MFAKDSQAKDGLTYKCKQCMSQYRKSYYDCHREAEQSSAKARYSKKYHSEKHKAWRAANPDKDLAKAAKRRASVAGRTPAWLSDAERDEILAVYAFARAWSDATRTPHHVDHIAPLRGKAVSGLHVPWNLRIVSAKENLKKGNRLTQDLTMI